MRYFSLHFVLFLTAAIYNITVIAQTKLIDSLEKQLSINTTRDTNKVKILNELIYEVHFYDLDRAESMVVESERIVDSLNYLAGRAELLYFRSYIETVKSNYPKVIALCKEAFQIYESLGHKTGASYTLTNLGIAYYRQHDFSNAIEAFEQSNRIDRENNDLRGVSSGFHNIGNIYADQGLYEKAILNYEKSLELKKEVKDSLGIAWIYENIGTVYSDQSNYSKGLEMFNKALNIYDVLNLGHERALLLLNLGKVYMRQEQFDKSLTFTSKALEIYRRQKNQTRIASCLNEMANYYISKQEFEKALSALNEALQIHHNIDDPSGLVATKLHLGDVYYQLKKSKQAHANYSEAYLKGMELGMQISESAALLGLTRLCIENKEYQKALKNLSKVENIAKKLSLLEHQEETYELYAIVYNNLGEYKKAFKSHQQFKLLSDSLFNEENIQKFTALEYEYMYQNELESANKRELKLTNKIESTSNDLEKSNQILLLSIIGFLMVIVLLGSIIFYLRFKNLKALTERIVIEQKLLRSQMTPHFTFNALSVLQGMILNKEEQKANSYLSKFSKLLRITLENSRDKMVTLHSELTAIESYLDLQNLELSNSLSYSIEVSENIDRTQFMIPPMLIQPFVENSIQHGFRNMKKDRIVDIKITFINEDLKCTIEDNGAGINTQEYVPNLNKKSLSTEITSERLNYLSSNLGRKGSVLVEDRAVYSKKGTIVTLEIPYQIA